MTGLEAATLIAALAFASIHLLAPRMTFIEVVPRSGWLSFAGGVAVAYVFLHLLPELSEHEQTLAGEGAGNAVWLLSLTGLATFYGLERMVREARRRKSGKGEEAPETAMFWIHVASFAVYNVLIGYLLLHREEPGAVSLALYVGAMGLHFLTNDFGMHQDHAALYDRRGRWLLAAAVLAGWALGLAVEVDEAALIGLFAYLAGGVVLNVLKEELPEERESRFGPFLAGVAGYGVLLLVI